MSHSIEFKSKHYKSVNLTDTNSHHSSQIKISRDLRDDTAENRVPNKNSQQIFPFYES